MRIKLFAQLCCVALVFSLATSADAQQRQRDLGIDESQFRYIGTESGCKRCHEKGELTEDDRANGVADRVQLNEWATWHNADKHAHAYAALKEERGQRMAEYLKKDIFAASTGCIQCHISNVNLELWDSKCGTEEIATNTCVSEGVGCEACHGPASQWSGPHWQGDWWKLSDQDKAAVGYRPIRNPRYRAELCLSCHLGDPRENKVITHEMYAAGHPPLSGFELESFVNRMPRHWRQSYEKDKASKNYERTRNMLLGNVVALRLAVETAAADVAANGRGDRWPEFARLECYSCHHDLRLPSWRQQRSTSGHVGRPFLNLGSEPLVKAAAFVADGEAGRQKAETLLARIQTEVFAKSIFGDPEAISALNPVVEQWCIELEAKLLDVQLDTAAVVQILDDVIDIAGQDFRDYDTARQLAGATIIVSSELKQIDPAQAVPSQVEERLAKLQTWFNLHQDSLREIEASLKESLQRRAEFEPELFTRLMTIMQQYRQR